VLHEFGAGHGFLVEGFKDVVSYEAFGNHGVVSHPVSFMREHFTSLLILHLISKAISQVIFKVVARQETKL
jgi:hypothetical protein